LDAQVRILFEPTGFGLHVPEGRPKDELAPRGFRSFRFVSPRSQKLQLVLVEASSQAQQQTVVAASRVVGRILVDEQRIHESTHLDQLLPFATVSSKPRELSRGNRADSAQGDLGHQALKAYPLDRAARRSTEIIVDDVDRTPSELSQSRLHAVLQPTALIIVL
jgi:hypothetical protein